MTRETYYIGAYWGTRAESRLNVAERSSATLLQLGTCHPLLKQWNQQADSYHDAVRLVVEPTAEAIEPLLTTDELDAPTCFGYDLWLWNGRETTAEQCTISINGGIVSRTPGGVPNNVVLRVPGNPAIAPDMFLPAVLLRALEIISREWRPDWGVVMSHEYSEQHVYPGDTLPVPGKPVVGWMTYLRAERLSNLPQDVPCKTVDVDGRGTIFTITDEHRFSVENPDDVARALALTAFLEEHGALETIPLNLPM